MNSSSIMYWLIGLSLVSLTACSDDPGGGGDLAAAPEASSDEVANDATSKSELQAKGGFAATCGNEFYNFDGHTLCANCGDGHGGWKNSCIDMAKYISSIPTTGEGGLKWGVSGRSLPFTENCSSCSGSGSSTNDPRLNCWCWGLFPNPGGLLQFMSVPRYLQLNECFANRNGVLAYDC